VRVRAGAAGRGSGALHREDLGAVHRQDRADPGLSLLGRRPRRRRLPTFTADGRTVGAWRLLWTGYHGPLPPRVVVMHQSCDEPSCTRPDHLRAGSQAENLASAAGRDRSAGWRHTGRADRRAELF